MAKLIYRNKEARDKLLKGVEQLADIVGSSLGPRSANTAIDLGYATWVIHDGVNIARQIELKDPAENLGVKIARESANATVQSVGDGTTATTILSHAIFKEAVEQINSGVNPMSLRHDLEQARDEVIVQLERMALPITTEKQKIQVATISAEDESLGEMIGGLIHDLGDGVITVEDSRNSETYIERQEGMQFDRGYNSPYFLTNPTRGEATVENAYILVTTHRLNSLDEIAPFFEREEIAKGVKNLVIIAPEITGDVQASLVVTKVQGKMSLLGIHAPLFGEKQRAFLEDIAVLTGGVLVDEHLSFNDVTATFLGKADRVTSTKDATLIVGGKGDKKDIEQRVKQIEAEMTRHEGSEFELEKLRERKGKLSSGIAVVKVGGSTDVEMKERKERAIDAVAATQAAVRSGIVPGGETIYLKLTTDNQILFKALKAPYLRLIENAGIVTTHLEFIKNEGIDVTDGKVKDMIKAGIIDPLEVSRQVITNAVSVAIQLFTTATIIVEEPKEEK